MAKLLLCLARISRDSESVSSGSASSAFSLFGGILVVCRGLLLFDLGSQNSLAVSDAAGNSLLLFHDLDLRSGSRLAGFAIDGVNEQFAIASGFVDHGQVGNYDDGVGAQIVLHCFDQINAGGRLPNGIMRWSYSFSSGGKGSRQLLTSMSGFNKRHARIVRHIQWRADRIGFLAKLLIECLARIALQLSAHERLDPL